MNKNIVVAAAVAAAMMSFCQSASADEILDFILGHHPKVDRRVAATGLGVNIASTVGYFAITDWKWNNHATDATQIAGLNTAGAVAMTTVGCAVLSPMIATLVVDRPLTYREADSLIAGCVVPFVGPWLVNRWFDTHPELDPDRPKMKTKRIARRRHR